MQSSKKEIDWDNLKRKVEGLPNKFGDGIIASGDDLGQLTTNDGLWKTIKEDVKVDTSNSKCANCDYGINNGLSCRHPKGMCVRNYENFIQKQETTQTNEDIDWDKL